MKLKSHFAAPLHKSAAVPAAGRAFLCSIANACFAGFMADTGEQNILREKDFTQHWINLE
jgi:hypothetical protein